MHSQSNDFISLSSVSYNRRAVRLVEANWAVYYLRKMGIDYDAEYEYDSHINFALVFYAIVGILSFGGGLSH